MYVTQAEVEYALTVPLVAAAYDDDQDGVVDEPALEAAIARASSMVDSWIAPVYAGPFPITQQPVPAMIRELTLQFVEALTYDRRPDLARITGSDVQQKRWDRANDMGKRLQSAVQRIPDNAAQPKPSNVGGIVTDDAKRVIIAGRDGYANRGDF